MGAQDVGELVGVALELGVRDAADIDTETVVVATIGYASATCGLLSAVIFGLGFGIGWFGLLIPAIAAIVASFAVLVARGRSSGMERPRWPWERDDEE